MEEKTNTRKIMMTFEEASELVDFITDNIYDHHRKSKTDEGSDSEFGHFLSLTELIEAGKTDIPNIGIDSFAVKQAGSKLYVSKLTHGCWNVGDTDKYSHLVPYLYILGLNSSDYPRINIQLASYYDKKSIFKDGFSVGETFSIKKELCQGDVKLYSLEWDKAKVKNLFGLDAEHFEKLKWDKLDDYWMDVERNSLSRWHWTPMILKRCHDELILATPNGRERLYFDYTAQDSFEGEMVKKVVKPKNIGNGVIVMSEDRIPKYLQRVLGLKGEK